MAIQTIPKPALQNIGRLAKLMDSQFRIPGTNIRFGLDALVGLVPGVGDFATFIVSGYMLSVLAKNGASGYVLARMLLNVFIDTTIGAIPLIGDIFDIGFKSNQLNMRLMHEHYVEGRHRGGAWKVILPVLLLLFIIIGGVVWLLYNFFTWLF